MCGVEILVKGEQLAGHASPKGVGVPDRLIVELFVVVKVVQVWASWVLLVESFRHVESVHFMSLGDLGICMYQCL